MACPGTYKPRAALARCVSCSPHSSSELSFSESKSSLWLLNSSELPEGRMGAQQNDCKLVMCSRNPALLMLPQAGRLQAQGTFPSGQIPVPLATLRDTNLREMHSAASPGGLGDTAQLLGASPARWLRGGAVDWDERGELRGQPYCQPRAPRGTNPKCKHFTMLPSTATSPAGPTGCARGQGHPAGTAVPVQGLFAPNYSLTLLLASSQVWCSEHGTSPRATSQRFGSTKIPAAGKSSNLRQLSCSPHASRKAAVRWEAGKGMCCPCRSLGISPNAVGMRLCHGESPTRPATASQPSASTAGLAETSGKHRYG